MHAQTLELKAYILTQQSDFSDYCAKCTASEVHLGAWESVCNTVRSRSYPYLSKLSY